MGTNDIWGPLVIALIASMTQACGISLQRKAHLIYQDANTSLYKQPLWISGFLIYTLSNLVGSTCTIGYLPIVILAPVGAIGLVFNAIFAKWILGDPFTKRTIFGTGLIVLGAGLIAGFGTVPEPNHTLDDLIKLYKRPSFIVYFSLVEAFILIGLLSTHVLEYWMELRPYDWISAIPDLKMYLGISYGVLGANISSQAMLFAKSGLELLILTLFQHDNQFIYPLTWAIVLALILTAILQLYYLNRGVQLCDTIILVPLNFCSFNVSCLFNGLVYYNQVNRLYWWQLLAVFFGIIILICGVLIISLQQQPAPIMLSDDVSSNYSDYSHPLFFKTSSLDEEAGMSWWTRMKFIYNKPVNEPDEHTGLLNSI
ncbi:putative magnesium transporter NIPA8 [Choanephora cucurbitarum]|uniref:Putative magnesium transporter NIPA8 n=1 Tax=Choanephora cucurbitarum TaxID=101091 RepID=A0A1C7NSL8_9FUNG|nr:putative magnesium transporter NIPA8 [Choanephora cucurbitarum]